MILAKLETPAVKYYQNGAFDTTSVNAEYMVVGVMKYIIGFSKTTFDVRFGNIILENEEERFDCVIRELIEMTPEELSNWGTDDSVLLDIIAEKIGAKILEKIEKDFIFTY